MIRKPRKRVPHETPDPDRQREIEETFAFMYLRVHSAMTAYKMACPEVSDSTALQRGKEMLEKPSVKMLIAEYEDRSRQKMPADVFYDILDQMLSADRVQLLECSTWAEIKALPVSARMHIADGYVDQKGNVRIKLVSLEKVLELKQRLYLNETTEQSPLRDVPRELLEQMVQGKYLQRNRD